MRVILADLKAKDGYVSKDTVAGGYGSRLIPFSKVSRIICFLKQQYHAVPSVQMAYLAAIFADAGHEVAYTEGEPLDGDVAIVLSSLVDYRNETKWAEKTRERGTPVGFVGLTASKLPYLFEPYSDFVIDGEPEAAIRRLANGETLSGRVKSPAEADLDTLPFPRWDLIQRPGSRKASSLTLRPMGGGFSVNASRSCPEFCTYCPHRILTTYRMRSVTNIADELSGLCQAHRRPYVIFRDPLFTQNRERVLELCDEIRARNLNLRFECETRLDRLDPDLMDAMHAAGFRAMSFGVESVSPDTLKKVGRRPIPPEQQSRIINHAQKRGILTAAFYVLGFPHDDWMSIAATIEYSMALNSTFAQFKLLTPYPGTPLWKQLQTSVYEPDLQKFDGFTPTFTHPNLTADQLRFLLMAGYTRFYMRPSFAANYCRIHHKPTRAVVGRLDRRVSKRHDRDEMARGATRPVTC